MWQHEAIQEPHSVAASWVNNARQQYLQAFADLTDDEKHTALTTIRQWRAALSEKIWYEEIISLDEDSQQLACIQQDVQQAKNYFSVLSEQWQDNAALAQMQQTQAWFRRLYQRLPRQQLDASASLQRITARVYKDNDDFNSQWLNPQKLPPSDNEIQQAVVYQRGHQLYLQRYQPFNLPEYGYSHIALIKLRHEQVQVLVADKVTDELSLGSRHGVNLPVEQQVTLISDQETVILQTQPYIDYVEMGRDVYGLYADIDLFGVVQRFRYIEAGTFMMGSPKDEVDRHEYDEDYHQVTLSKGYWLADTACTQELWQAVMGDNPADFDDDPQNPVESISWLDVQDFLQKLNQHLPHLQAQLPSDAQWEYACRAGTITPFSFGENITSEQVNYNGDYPYAEGKKGKYRAKTIAVKALLANQWGLYQMHGNVREWCSDEYQNKLGTSPVFDPVNTGDDGSSVDRVLRGGSWFNSSEDCRSAIRFSLRADDRYGRYGFRFSLGHELQTSQTGIVSSRDNSGEADS